MVKRIKRRRRATPQALTVIEGGKGQAEAGGAQAVSAGPGAAVDAPLPDGQKGKGKLTNKQRAFVRAMLRGAGSQSAAYREAYDAENMSAKAIGVEASRLMQNPSVSLKLTQGFAAQEEQAVHSGASLRVTLEQFFLGVVKDEDEKSSDRLRAAELVGKSEKVGYFLERTSTTEEELTPAEVEQELNRILKNAFKSTG